MLMHRRGVRAPRVCALKLLANLRFGGVNLVDTILEGVQEQSRLGVTIEFGMPTEVDNQETVKIGDLENAEVIKVVRPNF